MVLDWPKRERTETQHPEVRRSWPRQPGLHSSQSLNRTRIYFNTLSQYAMSLWGTKWAVFQSPPPAAQVGHVSEAAILRLWGGVLVHYDS